MSNIKTSKLPSAEEASARSNAVIQTHKAKVESEAIAFIDTRILQAQYDASENGKFEAEVNIQCYYYNEDLALYCNTIENELHRLGYETALTGLNNGSPNAKKLFFSWAKNK